MSGGISTERCRPLPATQSPMESIEQRVAGEVKAMTRKEVIVKTIRRGADVDSGSRHPWGSRPDTCGG